jgi:RNA polymerase sigma-70 factor (ECF subfamily)
MPIEVLAELFALRDDAYRFALRIVRSPQDAEDVVQESFLRASRLDSLPAANQRTLWFLGVVRSVASNQRRAQHQRQRIEKKGAMVKSHSNKSNHEALSLALAEALDQLEEKYRLPISLRYEQGLSYEEVSGVLGIRQDTLRAHVKRGLDMLRGKLAAQSYAVTPSVIVALLTTGFGIQAPASLTIAMEELIQSVRTTGGSAGATAPVRTVPKLMTRTGSKVLVAGVALSVAATGGIIYFSQNTSEDAPTHSLGNQAPAAVTSPPNRLSKKPLWSRRWDFNSPDQAREFQVIEGAWNAEQNAGENNTGCMRITSPSLILRLPIEKQRLPISVEYRFRSSKGNPRLGIRPVQHKGLIAFTPVSGLTSTPPASSWLSLSFQCIADFASMRTNNVILSTCYIHDAQYSSLLLTFKECELGRIDNIQVREMDTQEVEDFSRFRSVVQELTKNSDLQTLFKTRMGEEITSPAFIEQGIRNIRILP